MMNNRRKLKESLDNMDFYGEGFDGMFGEENEAEDLKLTAMNIAGFYQILVKHGVPTEAALSFTEKQFFPELNLGVEIFGMDDLY